MLSCILDLMQLAEDDINEEVQGDKTYKNASKKAYELYEKLNTVLSKEQIADFEKFVEYEIEQSCVREEKCFEYGLKYGLRLMSECMRV